MLCYMQDFILFPASAPKECISQNIKLLPEKFFQRFLYFEAVLLKSNLAYGAIVL